MTNNRLFLFLIVFILLSGCAAPAVTGISRIETGVDPNAWALVPAGEFLYGQHEIVENLAYDYEIMLTDVTTAQFVEYLNQAVETGSLLVSENQITGFYPGDAFQGKKHEERIDPGQWLHLSLQEPNLRIQRDGGRFAALPGYENHPMTMITWFAAKSYCEAGGGRLPTEKEWEKAARGVDDRPFPWGEELARNQANYYSSSDIFEKVFGKAGNTTPVGFFNGNSYDGYQTLAGHSPYGLYDMAGNVWQWTGDIYPGAHYRFLRGGSKADYGYNLRVWTRNNASPDYYSPNVGFRCVRDVP